jgi:hypothetical protein
VLQRQAHQGLKLHKGGGEGGIRTRVRGFQNQDPYEETNAEAELTAFMGESYLRLN